MKNHTLFTETGQRGDVVQVSWPPWKREGGLGNILQCKFFFSGQ